MTHAIIIFLTILLLGVVLYYSKYLKEDFTTLPSDYANHIDKSAAKFNPITNMNNPVNPIIPFNKENASLVQGAFNSIDLSPSSTSYNVTSGSKTYTCLLYTSPSPRD